MWKDGEIKYSGTRYLYQMKIFEVGSEFGINGGKISELWIWRKTDRKKILYQYSRETVIPPVDKDVSTVLQYIIDKYN